MKYIAACVLNESIHCRVKIDCPHRKPHEFNHSCNIKTECDCVPMDLEYYMRKIIKEHEENK